MNFKEVTYVPKTGWPHFRDDSIITVRNEVAKVMFLQVCVCSQEGGVPGPGECMVQGGSWSWGVGIPACTETAGGVWSQGGGVPGPGGAWSRGCIILGGLVSQHALRQTPPPPGETTTAADGTHPTGMHSCFKCDCKEFLSQCTKDWIKLKSYNRIGYGINGKF